MNETLFGLGLGFEVIAFVALGLVIVGLTEDCIMVRRSRKKLKEDLAESEWHRRHSSKRCSELALERDGFRDRNRQLNVEKDRMAARLQEKAELAESYRLMAARYLPLNKN